MSTCLVAFEALPACTAATAAAATKATVRGATTEASAGSTAAVRAAPGGTGAEASALGGTAAITAAVAAASGLHSTVSEAACATGCRASHLSLPRRLAAAPESTNWGSSTPQRALASLKQEPERVKAAT